MLAYWSDIDKWYVRTTALQVFNFKINKVISDWILLYFSKTHGPVLIAFAEKELIFNTVY